MGVEASKGIALNIGLLGFSSPQPPIPAAFFLNHKSNVSTAVMIKRSITILITTSRYVAMTALTANDCCWTSIAAMFHPHTSKKSNTAPFKVWSSININTGPTLPSASGAPFMCNWNTGAFSAVGSVNRTTCIASGTSIRRAIHAINRPRYFFSRATWFSPPVVTLFSCGSRDKNLSRVNAINIHTANRINTIAQTASASWFSELSRNSMTAPSKITPRGRAYHRHSKKITRTKRWAALRVQALRRDGFRCVQCGARGRLEIDHIKPVRTHPELSFDLANLQSLCPSCHTRKTRIECGHPPPSPERIAWREAVKELQNRKTKPCLSQ